MMTETVDPLTEEMDPSMAEQLLGAGLGAATAPASTWC